MTKKLLSLLVGILLVAALSGCDSTPGANNLAAGETSPSPKIPSTSQTDKNTPIAIEAAPSSNMLSTAPADVVTPIASKAVPGSDAMSTPQPDKNSPDPANVVTLDNGGVSMRVLWTISGYVLGKGFNWDEQAAQALLFKPLDINDTEIIFNGHACQGVIFQKKTVTAADYLANTWQTTPQELGIDVKELQVIKTNCALPGFKEYMHLGDGRLIVPINGAFFFFDPAVAR
jgi:hypothetical protein